ncbi:MAG TPA: hypothetical protein VLJ59_19785 [Mycobacteriales bacterium]|nr:hypothetical protein [Mycobacteriales bacterium]
MSRIETAAQLAAHGDLGEVFTTQFCFSLANAHMHRMAVALESQRPELTIETAKHFQPDSLPSAERRASYWVDVGRAHAALRKDKLAVAAFRRAEVIAPLRVRLHPLAREAVAGMVVRAHQAAVGRDLRGLAYRMGVPH